MLVDPCTLFSGRQPGVAVFTARKVPDRETDSVSLLPARLQPRLGEFGARFQPHDRLLLPALILAFLALLLVVTISQPTDFDRWLGGQMQAIPWGSLEFLPQGGSTLGGGWVGFYVVPAVAAISLAVLRKWKLLVLLAAAYGLHYLLITPKLFLETYRPSPVFGVEGSGGLESFPSGHVQWATSFYGFLAFVAWRELPRQTRWFVVPGYTLIVVFTMLGRIELGRHWPSDTVAGLLVGLLAARTLAFAYDHWCRPAGTTVPGSASARVHDR